MGRAGIGVAAGAVLVAGVAAAWLWARTAQEALDPGAAGPPVREALTQGTPVTADASRPAPGSASPSAGAASVSGSAPASAAPGSTPWPPATEAPAAGGTVRDERGVPVAGARLRMSPVSVPVWEPGALQASTECVTSADGAWWYTWPPNEPIPPRVQVTLDPAYHRFRAVTPLPVEGGSERHDLDMVVRRNPGIRLRILDAGTRAAVGGVTVEPATVEPEDGALLVWLPPDATAVLVAAEGYVSARVRVSPPAAGVADHPEPVLMERGCALGGVVRGPTGSALPDAVVFVELLRLAAEGVAWPVATGTTDGEGRYRLGPLLAGRYRLRVFAAGHAPGRERLDLAAEDLGHDLALVARAPGATPPEAEFAWADRRNLAVPLEVGDVPIGELIEWLEEVAGVRTARPEAVRERLAATHVSIAVTGLPLRTAFELIASVADLVFDSEAGTWALPGRQDGGGGDGG